MQGEWAKQIDLLCNWASTHLKASKVSLHAYREAGVTALLLNAVKNINREIVLKESPVSYLFNQDVAPDYFSMALYLPEIMKWGDISLAAAMTNARVNFICPVMSDGAGISPEEALVWKKEFDSVISKCRSETIVTFN
jgi:hypothetical protein